MARVNDNAYKLDLPGENNVSATFNISDLSPFDVGDDSGMNPFEERGNDENHRDDGWKAPMVARGPLHIPEGPITRVRAQKIKEALNGLIQDIQANPASNEANSSLTRSPALINIIRILK